MKSKYFIALSLILLISCNKNEEMTPEEIIIGYWEVIINSTEDDLK